MATRLRLRAEVDASPQEVWDVMTDFASFPAWNPFIRQASGDLEVGSTLDIRLRIYSFMLTRFKPTVTVVEPGRELRWKATLGVPGLFDVDRYFVLEPLADGRTRFVQGENATGPIAGLLMGTGLDRRIMKGYKQFARALRRQVAQRSGAEPAAGHVEAPA